MPDIIAISLLSESVSLKTNLTTAVLFSYHSCGKKEARVWKERNISVVRKVVQ